MSPGSAIAAAGFTHLVWIPDSTTGRWEAEFGDLPIVRPAREGEAVGIAIGLMLGGARPLVIMQCTGFFEAGDAIRNAVFDLGLPLKLLVGVRSAKNPATADNCPRFAEPLVRAWGLPFAWGEDIAALEADGAFVLLWPE